MAQDVLGVNGHGRGVGTQVNECTARALLCLCQHHMAQLDGGHIHLNNLDICGLEALA